MKKLSFLFAMVLAASFAMAQNTAEVRQNGPNNKANVNQIGTNKSVVLQTAVSTGNEATVNQTGGYEGLNDSYIEQQGGSGGKQQAFATQDGSLNQSIQKQLGPYPGYDVAKITQTGKSNKGEQYQKAYNNTAILVQSGDNNSSIQDQTNSGDPKWNSSNVSQSGNENTSITKQGGTSQFAKVVQDGLGENKSSVEQSGGGWNGGGHNSEITQIGYKNTSDVKQTGSRDSDGLDNEAYVNQSGDENQSNIIQNGLNNQSFVNQYGNNNAADITQQGSAVNDNYAEVNQDGEGNGAMIEQKSNSNIAYADQVNGDDNTANISQSVGDGNEAYVTQGMVPNYYAAPYNVSSLVEGNMNKANVTQEGLANDAEVVQVGDNNITNLTQIGDNNVAYSYQGWPFGFWGETAETSALSSTNGIVNISQASNNNYGAVWQYGGDNNKVNVSQSEGELNRVSIAQGFIYNDANYNFTTPKFNVNDNSATINQVGRDNNAKLFQLGDGNTFSLTQQGNGNTVGGRGLSGLEAIRNGYFEQDGDDNAFNGVQTDGATLTDDSRQTGNRNAIEMSQGEDDLAKIVQHGDLNDVFLTQMGGGQNATILQTGNSNVATVSQQ